MRRKGSLLIGIVIVVFILADWVLPGVVSNYAGQSLKELTNSDNVSVQAKKTPAVLMLTGQFDQVTIDADNAKVDKITLSSMHAVLNDAQLDMNALLMQKKFALKSVRDLNVKGTVSQAELARFLDANVKGSHNAEVLITPDKVTVSTNLSLGAIAKVVITLEGKVVSDGQKLKFVTDRFLLNHVLVGNIGGTMLTEIPLLDLKKLPFGTTIQDIVLENGQIVIVAGNHAQ